MDKVTIIGGGLAGCEAALQLAESGVAVKLYEMRPVNTTPAHETDGLAELVCSNSLKGEALETGAGLLKKELEMLGSFLIKAAKETRVPAGGALAVDRIKFSEKITEMINNNPKIEVIREEITEIPEDRPLIIASGPLTSDTLAEKVKAMFEGGLYFFDAISPIIDAESINYDKGFFKSRYDKGEPTDYLNLPMTKEEYDAFYDALMDAEKVAFKDFEKMNVFEGCMPIEEMASRGRETLTFGPMKPVGLEHPETGKRYHAVLQLRKENREGTAFNLVGFQTKMKIGEQKRVFSMIPGLETAEYLRFGSVHRNTYVNSPGNLDRTFSYLKDKNIFFAGQMTGVEGYNESIASGLYAALAMYAGLNDKEFILPETTAVGSLGLFVSGELSLNPKGYTPSNFHFGMLPALEKRVRKKRERKAAAAARAVEVLETYLKQSDIL